MPDLTWRRAPEEHDDPAAASYHRIWASYHTDEKTDIPCRLPGSSP